MVLDVPIEIGLEFMAIVGPHLADPEGGPGNDVVDEGDRIGLGVPVVDLERPDAGRIINGGVLVALDRLAVFSLKDQKLHVDLDLVPGDLLVGTIRKSMAPMPATWLCRKVFQVCERLESATSSASTVGSRSDAIK